MNTLVAGTLILEPQGVEHAAEMFEVLTAPAIYEFENSPPPSLAWLEARFKRLEAPASPDGTQQWLQKRVSACETT